MQPREKYTLAGMRICITGASRGLGRELAKTLAARGHEVWGIARDGEKLQTLQTELIAATFRTSVIDAGDPHQLRRWSDEMRSAGFEPDIVILNASVQHDDMRETFDASPTHETLAVNLESPLQIIGLLLPSFQKRGRGTFVAITSSVALRPSARSASYAASKAGLSMAMRSLRLKYASEGIRFAEVCLGPIDTGMWEGKRGGMVPNARDAADRIASFALQDSGGTLYYPFLSTLLLRLSLWLPDSIFAFMSSRLLK